MLGGADNPNGELPSYITGADKGAVLYPRIFFFVSFSIPDSQENGDCAGDDKSVVQGCLIHYYRTGASALL